MPPKFCFFRMWNRYRALMQLKIRHAVSVLATQFRSKWQIKHDCQLPPLPEVPYTGEEKSRRDKVQMEVEILLGKRHRHQFSSVPQSCSILCDPMDCSTPGLPVHHQLLEFTQTHVIRVGDTIQPPHTLLSLSPPAPNLSQYQSLYQWVNSSHEVAKVMEFQLQHQSFQWTPRTDLL